MSRNKDVWYTWNRRPDPYDSPLRVSVAFLVVGLFILPPLMFILGLLAGIFSGDRRANWILGCHVVGLIIWGWSVGLLW